MKSSLLNIISGLLCLCTGNLVMAQTASGTVDIEKVKTVARNYCLKTEKKYAKATADDINLTLVETKKSDDAVLYYIFDIGYHGNDGKGDGYIIMSASYDQPPVIGYIPEGRYDAARAAMNTAFTDWMNSFADQIEYSIKNKKKSSVYQEQWGAYLTKGKMDSETMILNLTSKWYQDGYYNAYSPVADGSNGHPDASSFSHRCPTGCVATAMGQIMYYYQWPNSITGSYSYTDAANPNGNSSCPSADPSYGSLGFTSDLTCNWTGMVDRPGSVNYDISKLLYNCAISVDMDFAYCQSWTNTWKAPSAYSTYFSYNSSAQYIDKKDYSNAAWESIIINQIRNEKPVHYRGDGSGGHSFICYGYKTSSGGNEFYFNWGWGGDSDGFYTLANMLFPGNQGAIINITPTIQPNLSVNSVSVGTNPVATKVPNTVSFNVLNNGTRDAVSSTAAVYLSTDQTLDQSDVLITTVDVGSISMGGSVTKTADIIVDAESAGDYYILVEADTDHKVHESNETDNVTALQINVTITPAVSGEFRTVASGNWTSTATWQYFNGTDWVTPPSYPTNTNDRITVRSGHAVTLNTTLSVDQITIMTGGEVDISTGNTLTIANGVEDIDCEVDGKLVNSGTVTAIGKLYFGNGGEYNHARDGGTIPVATWDVNSNCNITGITATAPVIPSATQPFGNFTYNCPYQSVESISLQGTLTSIAGNFYVVSTGPIYNDLRLGKGESGDLTVNGDYVQTNGWFLITGEGGGTRKMTVEKNLSIQGGAFIISYLSGSGTLNVNGNFASSGAFEYSYYNSAGSTLNAKGNFTISGGTMEMSTGSGSGTLNVSGNFSHTGGTITTSNGGNGLIVFNGSSPQIYTSGGTVSNIINFTVNSGTYLQMGTGATPGYITGGGTFTLQAGATLGITSVNGITTAGTAAGNIQITTRSYNAGANYEYNGNANQNTGTGLPANLTGSLKINNSGASGANTVTLSNATTIGNGGSLNIMNGKFAAGTNLTMGTTSSISRSGGSMTGTPQGTGNYNLNYSGNSLTTTTELTGSGLNDFNVALNSGQTLTLAQTKPITGNLAVTSGILDLGSYNLNRASSGGTLSVSDGGTLRIGGTNSMPLNYAGHSFTSGSNVEYYGADQTITPETSTGYGNLTLSGTGTKLIAAGAAVTVQSGLTTSDKLTIMSDSLGNNGSLIVRGSTAGKVTYKRQLHKGPYGDYYYFSSPVVSNSDGNAATVTYVWSWDEPGGVWHVETGGTTGLSSCIGYNLAQKKTGNGLITFTGSMADNYSINATSPYADTINSGYIDYLHRTFTDGTNHSPTARSLSNYGGGGWNLLGNPYTSALNVLAFIAANNGSGGGQNNFDPNYEAVYLYDGSKPPHGKYYFIGVSDGWGSELTETTAIQAGQGFFVAAMNDKSTFVFNKNMQVHNTAVLMLKSTKPQNPWPGVELSATLGESTDATRVILDDNMSFDLDPGYDVGQMSTGMDIEIYTSLVNDNGRYFTRQAIPLTDPDQVTIPVGINCKKGGTVTFSAKTVDLGHYKFYLEDRATGITTDLNTGSYTAVIPAKTYGTGRFYLITSYSARRYEDPEKQPATDISGLRIWTTDNKVIISGEVSADALFSLYDLSGRKIVETRLNDQNYNTVDIPSGAKGIFIAVVKDGSGTLKSKIAVP